MNVLRPRSCGMVVGLCFLVAAPAAAAPCGDPYGSSVNRQTIENAMYSGTAAAVREAINAAKETRGAAVGCPEAVYARGVPNGAAPSLQAVAAVWETLHAPRMATYDAGCPTLGREWPAAALGAYYARLAGYDAVPLEYLSAIADDMRATQYSGTHAPMPAATWQGSYAYAYSLGDPGDPCYRGGIMDVLPAVCAGVPGLCVTYTGGKWSGRNFIVGDFWTSPRFYDGGMAYDHGWTGAMMIEAAIQQAGHASRDGFMESVLFAGEWSAAEPPVRNHNYTAKNIWLLAQLYGLTGAPQFKAAMLDKLERNLKPGVLTDWDTDGMVDGMVAQPFNELWVGAQRPGRNWDGHNALLWYGCMNTWAMVEAYVALRDRGDTAEAAALRPYAVIMLDNLAWELTNLGPAATLSVSMHSIPYAFLVGLWKVAAYENDTQPDWEQAAWVLWNTGYPNTTQNGTTANVGLYLLYLSGAPYVPLAARLAASACPECEPEDGTLLFVGDDACLGVAGAGPASSNFQWSKDGEGQLQEGRYQGVNCPTLLIAHVGAEDAGTYRCAYDDGGPAVYAVTIEVQEPTFNLGDASVLVIVLALAVTGFYVLRRPRSPMCSAT